MELGHILWKVDYVGQDYVFALPLHTVLGKNVKKILAELLAWKQKKLKKSIVQLTKDIRIYIYNVYV